MNATALLSRLRSSGVTLTVRGDKIRWQAPRGVMTPELRREIVKHKPDIIEALRPAAPGNVELTEIERHVEQDGYVLLWASELDDLVAFCRTEAERSRVPPGFVVYSREELTTLFGDASIAPSLRELRLIHHAKKLGRGTVLGQDAE